MRPGDPDRGSFADRFADIDRRIGKLETAARLTSASVGSGGITVKDGGKLSFLDTSGNVLFTIDENGLITFEADGSQLSVLDGTRLRFNRSDGTRSLEITPAGGQKLYAANGTTELVVLDADGLHVAGGLVQSLWFASSEDVTANITLTTSPQTVGDITIDPPDYVEEVTIFGFARATITNPGSEILLVHRLTLDDGGSGEDSVSANQDVLANRISNTMLVEEATVSLSPAGRSINITQEAHLSSGTFSDDLFSLKVLVIGVRSAFT